MLKTSFALGVGAKKWYTNQVARSSNQNIQQQLVLNLNQQVRLFSKSCTLNSDLKALTDSEVWTSFPLVNKNQLSADTTRLRYRLPSENHTLGLTVASCILVQAEVNGEKVIKPYTPVTTTDTKGYFDLVIKKYPAGRVSSYCCDMEVGNHIDVRGPLPKYNYVANRKRDIGMIAGGSGVTPMFQVVQEVLSNPEDQTHIRLLYANNTEQDILLRSELDNLASKHENFDVQYILAKPPSNWSGCTGFVTKELCAQYMPKPIGYDTDIFVCGPPPMMEAISGDKAPDKSQGPLSGILKELGYTEDHVYKF